MESRPVLLAQRLDDRRVQESLKIEEIIRGVQCLAPPPSLPPANCPPMTRRREG
jgi:hypothetical protein